MKNYRQHLGAVQMLPSVAIHNDINDFDLIFILEIPIVLNKVVNKYFWLLCVETSRSIKDQIMRTVNDQ